MNSVQLIGRLTADPEIRYTAGTQMAVAKFRVAIDDGYGEKKRTNFIPVTVFGKTAENCEKFLKKGLLVGIQGKIQTGSYEKDGKTHYTMDVISERVEFLQWAEKNQPQQNFDAAPEGFSDLMDDIPF